MSGFFNANVTSPFPDANMLFDPAKAQQTAQGIQANQLGLQARQLDLTAADHEQVGRLAAGLLNEPDLGKRAELYSRGVGMLQAQNLAKYAPPTLPDESTLRSLVSQTIPAQTQAEWLQNLAANKAYTNAGNTASTGAPGTTTGAVAPGSVATTPSATIEPAAFNNATAVRDGLIKRGMDPDTATGAAANALHESVANPRTGRGDNGNAAGIFMWTGPRLQAYIDKTGHPPDGAPLDEQLDFLMSEWNGSESAAAAKIAAAQGPAAKAAAFSQYFLRPKDTQGEMQRRSATALQLQQQIGGGATTASAAPAGGGGPSGSYQVASTAPTAPPGSTAAPGGPPTLPPAASPSPAQPVVAPAGGPAPPQLQPLNANGLTPVQQRQIDALAANPQNKQPVIVAQQQAFQNQNIALAQKAFSDYVQLQQLEVSKGTLTNSQAETNLKYWQAQHPELAPNARVQTLAYRTLQELAPVVRQGNAPQDVIDKYNNAATEYQEFKEVTDPVTKQLKSVPTRPLPPGFPEPTGTGASGGVRTLTEGLSPSQQQVERDPAAYKVSESQYDRDSKEIAAIGDAGRQSQADQVRVKEMQDVLQKFNSGRGTEAATAAAAWFNSWAPAGLTGWQKESANLSGSQAAEAFSKLALVGAGTQERGVLGARGGYQAIKLFKEANPNINLQDATNKSILDMQLISNQANADYSQAALSHFADNEKKFSATHQYDSLAQFDRNWNGQRNPQVYAAAMGAIAGQPPSQWTKGLSDDEYARALQIVQRAKPSAVVQTKNGPYSMQPNAVTTGTSAKPGDTIIRFDHNGQVIPQ